MTPYEQPMSGHIDRLPWPAAFAAITVLSATLWGCIALMAGWI